MLLFFWMSWRRCLRPGLVLATWLAGAASGGCDSPTLPLPPPEAPQVAEVSSDGKSVHLVGGATPGALVLIFNDAPTVQAGVIVTVAPTGVYDAVVPTDLGPDTVNLLEMWQRVGKQDSSVIVFLVPLHGSFVPDAGVSPSVDAASPPLDAGGADGE